MSERAAFINAILDNPADDTARLVFADWLDEHGEPDRAEFIRVQIEADKLPEDVRRRHDLGERIAGKHGAALGGRWRKAVCLSDRAGKYVRGFLTDVRFDTTPGFFDHIRAVLEIEPVLFDLHIQTWHRSEVSREIASLAESPDMRAVTKFRNRISRYGNDGLSGFGAERFRRLMESPYLTNLREIHITGNAAIGLEGVEAIVNAPAAFVLESLVLSDVAKSVTDAIKAIATAPRFSSLKLLSLRSNRLNEKHVRTLLRSKTLPRTLHLELNDNEFDEDQFAEALAERFTGGSD